MKKALISGISGQDGSYLTELLFEKGYEVHGLLRRSSTGNLKNIKHIIKDVNIHIGDLTDSTSINRIIRDVMPDEIYNLGAFTHVGQSFKNPEYIMQVNGLGCLYLLEAIRNIKPNIRFYQASTSELFGDVEEVPQDENTRFNPVSPYGVSKQAAYYYTKIYREAYNLFACNGILFNHESPRRSDDFVSKKIIKAVVNISKGKQDKLYLGNLDAKRDWGYAKDYVEAMWLILQQDQADDFVIATNETHTVREFVELAFKEVGINIDWMGRGGLTERGFDLNTGEILIEIKEEFYRPLDVNILQGNYAKAEHVLKWRPKVKFNELIKLMISKELNENNKEQTWDKMLKENPHRTNAGGYGSDGQWYEC